MGQINLYNPTLLQQLLDCILGGISLVLLAGLIIAPVYLFKKSISPLFKQLSKGVIPLAIPGIALIGWKMNNRLGLEDEPYYGTLGWPAIYVLGLVSWIYIARKRDAREATDRRRLLWPLKRQRAQEDK